jgi:hypothetical protein
VAASALRGWCGGPVADPADATRLSLLTAGRARRSPRWAPSRPGRPRARRVLVGRLVTVAPTAFEELDAGCRRHLRGLAPGLTSSHLVKDDGAGRRWLRVDLDLSAHCDVEALSVFLELVREDEREVAGPSTPLMRPIGREATTPAKFAAMDPPRRSTLVKPCAIMARDGTRQSS